MDLRVELLVADKDGVNPIPDKRPFKFDKGHVLEIGGKNEDGSKDKLRVVEH